VLGGAKQFVGKMSAKPDGAGEKRQKQIASEWIRTIDRRFTK